MVQRFSQQDEEKMRRFVKKTFQGLLDMQRGLTKETFVSKETGDRMYTLWAYNQGLILTATGTWGTCTSHHRFSSQDFLKEAASVLKTCLFLVTRQSIIFLDWLGWSSSNRPDSRKARRLHYGRLMT